MPRAIRKSKKSKKKAYQRMKVKGKVCPEPSKRARKAGKRHTKERKMRKKYAPGHPSEHELQNRNKKQNNKNKPETKARIKPKVRTGNIYSRFVEKTYYMCYSNIGSFCLIFRKTERRKQYERMMKYGRIQKENL